MDNKSSDIDFALLGHQDSWEKISGFVNFLRKDSTKESLSKEKINEVYTYFPPRSLFDIEVRSITGKIVRGKYIETFISPDELVLKCYKKNVMKVRDAAAYARNLNAKVAALGGFTSIVLEGRDDSLNDNSNTKFTTGNTLTAAFIVKSIEKSCVRFYKELKDQNILVIGATGDIGSACVKYFSSRAKQLLLCSRQQSLLFDLEKNLLNVGIAAKASIDVSLLLPEADVIIAIASSEIENFKIELCKKEVIICDAGYPKNLIFDLPDVFHERLFCGGMGIVKAGYDFTPDIHHQFYSFHMKNIAHGCLIEAIVLAFENENIPYSTGKGNITPEKINEIYSLAQKHGISEAPFFNSYKVWD